MIKIDKYILIKLITCIKTILQSRSVEDLKVVIRIRKSIEDRQKGQTTIYKTKD